MDLFTGYGPSTLTLAVLGLACVTTFDFTRGQSRLRHEWAVLRSTAKRGGSLQLMAHVREQKRHDAWSTNGRPSQR